MSAIIRRFDLNRDKRRRAAPRKLQPASLLPDRLQATSYFAEGGAEIAADEAEGSDRSDGDQCGNQRIFDGGNSGFVPDHVGKKRAQTDSPRLERTIVEEIAHQCLNISKSTKQMDIEKFMPSAPGLVL